MQLLKVERKIILLDNTVSTLVPATIFMLLVFNVGPLKHRNEVKSAAILYLITLSL